MSLQKTLEENGLKEVDALDIGNAYQVTKDNELLGYIMKDDWSWKPKAAWKPS